MPFDATNDRALVKQILEGQYRVKRSAWQKVSPEAQDFVKRLLVLNASFCLSGFFTYYKLLAQ